MLINRIVQGFEVVIVAPKATEERLRDTCFRGVGIKCAGNFSKWWDIFDLFNYRGVVENFIAEISETFRNGGAGVGQYHSFEMEFLEPVGWSSTDGLGKYEESQFEVFNPSRRSVGLRIKSDLKEVLAPKTKTVTFVYSLKKKNNTLTCLIHSIYPGEDVGEIVDDVSSRENVVFFGWNHPGEE